MTKELNAQKQEAIATAETKLEEDKFLDAVVFYERAAKASKELGDMEEYQKYRDLAEDCLALRLELIVIEEEERKARMETQMMPPPKPKKAKKARKKLTMAAFKKQIDQMMTESKKSFITVVDATQKLEIPQTEVQELAEQAGYRVTKVRIYAKAAESKESTKEADEFSDLEDLDEVLAAEDEKEKK